MKALVYHGKHDVRVDNVPDHSILEATDMLLRVTATAICGSDLHLYGGKVPELLDGDILGHEFMGVVEDTGSAVTNLNRGDRVVIPFTIACGHCFFCEKDQYASCETTNPGKGGAINAKGLKPSAGMFGYSHLYGGFAGGQAEYVRVPHADIGPLKIPSGLADEQVLFLSDILPTGYQAVVNAEIGDGSTLAIFGAGPVGMMAAASARMLGASTIYMIDELQDRLDFAVAHYGVKPINLKDQSDPAKQIVEETHGRGLDASIDAVGFEAKGSLVETVLAAVKIEASVGFVLRQCIASTRRSGIVSVPGVYVGFLHGFMFGDAFDKGLTFRMGQTHVQHHMPGLLTAIQEGRLRPDAIISHRMKLSDAAEGYKRFNDRETGWRKIVMTP